MFLFPAIDLKDGSCVRLKRGDMSAATVFNDDPAAQAESFALAGAEWLHLVDLDGAFAGASRNRAAIQSIIARVTIPIQLGGGIRSLDAIEFWLASGIARVILGTLAVKNPALVLAACKAFPEQIVLGIDARDGRVAVEGWAEESSLTTLELARKFTDAGAAAIIFTDIDRDGLMAGPNFAATQQLAEAVSIPVIASGGVSSLADIERLLSDIPNLHGAIVGRALYDGGLDFATALAVAKRGQTHA